MGIYIGTSGYFFPDWSKTFYPKGLSQRLWLRYYIMHFPALELNSTFYAIPPQERIEKLVSQLPDDFVLTVKVPRSITHEEPNKKELSDYISELENAIAPAKDKKVFKGFLAQFPVSFRFSRKNFEKLKAIVEALTRPLFVEFRNSSWKNEETMDFLKENDVGWVIPDVPTLPELTRPEPLVTTEVAYLRLHGRNAKNWYGGGDRYDYFYSDEELGEIAELVRLISSWTKDTYVFFNNCHMGQAAINAKKFAKMFGQQFPQGDLFE